MFPVNHNIYLQFISIIKFILIENSEKLMFFNIYDFIIFFINNMN